MIDRHGVSVTVAGWLSWPRPRDRRAAASCAGPNLPQQHWSLNLDAAAQQLSSAWAAAARARRRRLAPSQEPE